MKDAQITLDMSQVIVAVVSLVGGYIASLFLNRNTKETSASSILDTVWTKLNALELRVSHLEGKVTRRDLLLSLSRGHILGMEEKWPAQDLETRPARHPELMHFLDTGLVELADNSTPTNNTNVKLEVSA